MEPRQVYELLIAEITVEDERKVFDALLRADGQRVTRQELVLEVYGVEQNIDEPALYNSKDRQVRDIISRLRERDYPIVSSSDRAGYTMKSSSEEMEAYIAQLRSRIEKLQANIDHAYRSKRRAELVKVWRESNPIPVQLSFMTQEVPA